MAAFCSPWPVRSPFSTRSPVCNSTPRRCRPYASLSLLAVQAESVLTQGGNVSSLSARIATASSAGDVYLLYVGAAGREEILSGVESAGLPTGDAVSARGGLYQKGYVTPDPFWRRKMFKAWDPKPARWVVDTLFEGRLDEVSSPEGEGREVTEIVLAVCGEDSIISMRDELAAKMQEMGIEGCIGLQGGSGSEGVIVVQPDQAGVGEVVEFCRSMLKVEGSKGVVFGESAFVDGALSLISGAVGVVPSGSGNVKFEERTFVSNKEGVDALLGGMDHFGLWVS